MPEVCQVLCCYKCDMFQVHFLKKSNKWQCLICNEKQSLKKAFRIGPAPQCRTLVQELNMQKANQKDNPAPHCRSVVRGLDMQKVCQIRNLNEDDTSVNEEEDRIDHSLRYRTPGGDEVHPALRNFIDSVNQKTTPVYQDEKQASENDYLPPEGIIWDKDESQMGNRIFARHKNGEEPVQVVETKDCHGQKQASENDYLPPEGMIWDIDETQTRSRIFIKHKNGEESVQFVKTKDMDRYLFHSQKQASENDYLPPEGMIWDIDETQMRSRIFIKHKNGEESVQVVETKDCHGRKKRPFKNVSDLVSVFLSDDSDSDETEMGNRIFIRHKNGEESVQVVDTKDCHGPKKWPFENASDVSSRALEPPFKTLEPPFKILEPPFKTLEPPFKILEPPFKKNRGFEIIKNAASKLS